MGCDVAAHRAISSIFNDAAKIKFGAISTHIPIAIRACGVGP